MTVKNRACSLQGAGGALARTASSSTSRTARPRTSSRAIQAGPSAILCFRTWTPRCDRCGAATNSFTSARQTAQTGKIVGGCLGRKFELVVRDDKADTDPGLAHAKQLVEKEKVNFSIDFCNTGVAMKALDVCCCGRCSTPNEDDHSARPASSGASPASSGARTPLRRPTTAAAPATPTPATAAKQAARLFG